MLVRGLFGIYVSRSHLRLRPGPVRAVDFHLTQPMFVSGGDDFKIKVWNYKQRKCLFTLSDHLDYIRTVQFHHEYPWIVSASDDQTIRIWNWQNRQCITTLTGHNHYVMSARFHPKEDLIVSASLDQTVRVWDTGPLRQQQLAAPARQVEESAAAASIRLAQQELFGTSPATLKYPPLEGHERGVNWAAFHPTLPLIVSAADDRVVKLWRMNESRAWEVDTLRGHFNNVSCVLFHPRQDLIVSNSEDKTIRVWDMAKRTCLHTFRREYDRFWILAAHPEQNVFAAGHDSGVLVFKLERERPAYTVYKGKHQTVLLYIKERQLRSYDLESGKDAPIMSVRKSSTSWHPVKMSYSPSENAILVTSLSEEGGSYELYKMPAPGSAEASSENPPQSKRGLGSDAVFFARNKFATLERSGHIVIRGMDNEIVRRLNGPAGATGLFAASSGRLLVRTDEGVLLVDTSREDPVARVTMTLLKYVVWSKTHVALLGKHSVVLCTRDLQVLCSVQETAKVKSGAWDDNGMFVYSTVNHIKYMIPNGDSGIIRTLETPVYLTGVRGNKIFCLDREAKTRTMSIDITESYFKMALYSKSYDTILKMVREANLIGNSIVGYLQKKGYPDIALHFVKDPLVRFNLALECSAIETALQAARQLELPDCWRRLAQAALAVGDYAIAELGFSRCGDTAALAMLYVCGGRMAELRKLGSNASARGDVMAAFHAQLLGGDMEGILSTVEKAGHVGLASLGKAVHGLAPVEEGVQLPPSALLRPPQHVLSPNVSDEERAHWPRLAARPTSVLDAALADAGRVAPAVAYAMDDASTVTGDIGDWGGDDLQLPGGGGADDLAGGGGAAPALDVGAVVEEEGSGWADLDLPTLDLGAGDAPVPARGGAAAASSDYFVPVGPGAPAPRMWTQVSVCVCVCVCACCFLSVYVCSHLSVFCRALASCAMLRVRATGLR
jgi:coatomer protein complex subunit alpha (xenin)